VNWAAYGLYLQHARAEIISRFLTPPNIKGLPLARLFTGTVNMESNHKAEDIECLDVDYPMLIPVIRLDEREASERAKFLAAVAADVQAEAAQKCTGCSQACRRHPALLIQPLYQQLAVRPVSIHTLQFS
jgi:hypothetical protein